MVFFCIVLLIFASALFYFIFYLTTFARPSVFQAGQKCVADKVKKDQLHSYCSIMLSVIKWCLMFLTVSHYSENTLKGFKTTCI